MWQSRDTLYPTPLSLAFRVGPLCCLLSKPRVLYQPQLQETNVARSQQDRSQISQAAPDDQAQSSVQRGWNPQEGNNRTESSAGEAGVKQGLPALSPMGLEPWSWVGTGS